MNAIVIWGTSKVFNQVKKAYIIDCATFGTRLDYFYDLMIICVLIFNLGH